MSEKLDEQTLSHLREEFGYEEGEAMDVAWGGFRWIVQPDGTFRCFELPRGVSYTQRLA